MLKTHFKKVEIETKEKGGYLLKIFYPPEPTTPFTYEFVGLRDLLLALLVLAFQEVPDQ